MLSQVIFRMRQWSRRLWVRAALISALAVLALALAPLVNGVLPRKFMAWIELSDVRDLLDILANSMLSVTTFSLTIMVTAHFAAAQHATPRAHRILRADTRTQTVLATFIGAFVYALASIVMLQTGVLNEEHHAVLYLLTLLVIALIIAAILRWVDHLSGLGSMEETLRRVETEARTAIAFRNDNPFLGGVPLPEALPETAHEVGAPRTGFVQHIDSKSLSETAATRGDKVYVLVRPGDWVAEGTPVMLYNGTGARPGDTGDDEADTDYGEALIIGDTRTFAQDVAFGLIVMSEIAQRALSPGVNDPRTAADVLARLVALVGEMQAEKSPDDAAKANAPGVHAAPLAIYDALENALDPIARDGAGFREIALHYQSAMAHLRDHRDPEVAQAARLLARRGRLYADAALPLEEDRVRVRAFGGGG